MNRSDTDEIPPPPSKLIQWDGWVSWRRGIEGGVWCSCAYMAAHWEKLGGWWHLFTNVTNIFANVSLVAWTQLRIFTAKRTFDIKVRDAVLDVGRARHGVVKSTQPISRHCRAERLSCLEIASCVLCGLTHYFNSQPVPCCSLWETSGTTL